MLAGTDRGLYVSTDGGSTFAAPTFTNPVLDVIADPINPQIDYLLAGPDSQGNGAGVYASTDAGQDWTAINDGALTSQVLDLMPTIAEAPAAWQPRPRADRPSST